MLTPFMRLFAALVLVALGVAAQDTTTINFGGKAQGVNDKIQWADNNDPMEFKVDLRIRLDNGTVVNPSFTVVVWSNTLSRVELAELVANQIAGCLIGAGVPPATAHQMSSSNGGTAVHVDNTKPADQPDGGGTPDNPIWIDHNSDAPVNISKHIS
jgi:hypothetical protein